MPSFSRCEVTKQFCSKLGRAVRYNPLFAASYLLAMTWDFHFHRSRKTQNVIYSYCFFFIEIHIAFFIEIAIAIDIDIYITILSPSPSQRAGVRTKKNPVSLETGFSKKGDI